MSFCWLWLEACGGESEQRFGVSDAQATKGVAGVDSRILVFEDLKIENKIK